MARALAAQHPHHPTYPHTHLNQSHENSTPIFSQLFRNKCMESPFFSQYAIMMRKRHATNELDRISGLASVTQPERLPIYDVRLSNEDAWEVLVNAIDGKSRAHLFFWYPVAGNSRSSWAPSWSQIMAEDVPATDDRIEGYSEINLDLALGKFCSKDFRVLSFCSVLGLGSNSLRESSGGSVVRMGTVIAKGQDPETSQQHGICASHQISIDKTVRYTLLYSGWSTRFVLGVQNDAGEVQKLCVLEFVLETSIVQLESIASLESVVLI